MAERQEYQSTHTGAELDAAVDRATLVVANPNDAPEATLTKINIANTIYQLSSSGVTSLGGEIGAITLGSGIIIPNNELQLKADTLITNITRTNQHDTVIESYISSDGLTWYRKWASGWKECGGYKKLTQNVQTIVALPLEFSSDNYIVTTSTLGTNTDQYLNGVGVYSRTATQLTFIEYDYGNAILYYCCGI